MKNLQNKKEKTFKAKDVSKWELKDDQLRAAQDVINDKEQAFALMHPQETKKVEYLAQESAYFTN